MKDWEELKKHVSKIEANLGVTFLNPELLALAFVHRSYVNEDPHFFAHNERLEFLGDSILGLLAAEYLYRNLPEMAEGDLSYLRSRLVEASSCVIYMQKLHVSSYLLLGKGERMNDGRGRDSILADLFEAIMGALFLDQGLKACETFFFSHFSSDIEKMINMPLSNWKANLQDLCQKKYQKPPVYEVIEEMGPDHSKTFKIAVFLNDIEMGQGIGSSKKEAQQAAAKVALEHLENMTEQK